MNCYATIITSESYMPGVRVLKRSLLKTGTQIPLVVFIPKRIANSVELSEWGLFKDEIHVYDFGISIPNEVLVGTKNSINSQWVNTFDKLLIFDCTKFEKIVFLDSDMMIMQNIDELFNYPHMATVSPSVGNADYIRGFNSGLMVIEPETGLVEKIMKGVNWAGLISRYDSLSDNDILIDYYNKGLNKKEELYLDDRYNFLFPYAREYTKIGIKDAKVIHFTGRVKPWDWDNEMMEKMCKDTEMKAITEEYLKLI